MEHVASIDTAVTVADEPQARAPSSKPLRAPRVGNLTSRVFGQPDRQHQRPAGGRDRRRQGPS